MEVSHGQIMTDPPGVFFLSRDLPGWSSPPKAVPELQIVWNPNPAPWLWGDPPYEISRVSPRRWVQSIIYIYIYIYVGVGVCVYVYIYISCWLSWRHEGCPCRWWEYMGIQPFGVGPIASNWTDVAWFCQIKVAMLDAYLLRTWVVSHSIYIIYGTYMIHICVYKCSCIYTCIYLSIDRSIYLSIYLSIDLSIYLFIHLSIYIYIYTHTHIQLWDIP